MTDSANSSSVLGFEGVPHFYLVKGASQDKETLEKCEKLIKDNWNTKTELKWLTTAECLKLDPNTITKTDVFVFPEFKGPAFDDLRSRGKALLLGPPALRKCLVEQETIPMAPPPWIFNTAMNGLVITLSGFREADKKKYMDLISFMGGLCMPTLPESATHLVSNTVFSAKYEAAQQLNIPVMNVQWIDEVWKRNATDFVAATSSQFDQYKLPVFYNLNVTCTLLSNDEKAMVERLVSGHGGIFHRTFKTNVVNILVVNENGKNSDKFKAACKHRKVCLLPKWISDSVREGYALPFSGYEVAGEVRVSTPNKDANQNPEFSVSHIQGSVNSTVNESLISVRSKNHSVLSEYHQVQVSTPPPRVPDAGAGISDDYYKDCMKNLNVTKAKKAGSFLDGCNIFFSGFTPVEMGKLNKIISLSGATRYEELNENVTHVVVGKRNDKELKAFQDMNKEIHFVKFDWLQESMRSGHAANEDDHCYELMVATNKTVLLEQPSPASKRNIAAMNSSFKRPFPKNDQMAELSKNPAPTATTSADADEAEDGFLITRRNLVSRYLQSTAENMDRVESAAPTKSNDNAARERQTAGSRVDQSRLMHSTFGSELESDQIEQLDFFCGKRFSIQGIDNDQDYMQVLADIQNFGGTIVEKSFKGEVDFLVTPPEMPANFKPQHKAKEIVSHWWVEDVISSRADVPVCYYHKLIEPTDGLVLRGIVCVISSYAGAERLFLMRIAQTMGAATEDKYVKKKYPILICDKAEGSKYKGAVTWSFPVVTKEWLLETYRTRHLQKLEDYLVGESKISEATHVEINDRGLHKGAEPPSPNDDDSSLIQLRTESPLLSQVPPSPMVGLSHKRKSDETDTFVRNTEKKLRMQDSLVLLPPNHSSNVNNRVKALRSESKSSASPTTPISAHVREMGQEFNYDTPHRTQLYDVLKEMENVTPTTPHTPAVMKMPDLRLHPDPEATPSRQWDVLHKFSGFLGREEKANELKGGRPKKKAAPATPLSEIKRRFWKETLGDDFPYENNSTMLNINSQQLEVQPRSADVTTMDDPQEKEATPDADQSDSAGDESGSTVQLQGLVDLIKRRKSEPKKPMGNLETCPVECAETQTKESDNEIMVGWADPSEVVPFRTPPLASRSTSRPPPYFLLSGLVVNAGTLNMVQELGGDMQKVKSSEYESRCTHIVCLKPGRVEKVLCAVAAGKWIISLKYIEDSYQAREFLDEERYEWANPKCEHPMEMPTEVDNQVAHAAYAWRMRIQDKTSDQYRSGAFHGFRVLLWAKTAGFKKIITAGGGVCLDVGATYRENAEVVKTATHCFVEKKATFPADNLLFCKEMGIRITDILSLNAYLLSDNLSALAPSMGRESRTSGGGSGTNT